MFRRFFHPVVLTIIVFAAIGIGVALFSNPSAFFTQILVTIGIVALLLLLMKKFILPRLMGHQTPFPQQRGGVHAKKMQSKPRKPTASFKKKQNEKKKSISRPLIKRQSDVKLTVIEGKKNKKKSRALF